MSDSEKGKSTRPAGEWCDNRNKTNSINPLIFNHFILFDLLKYPHKYPQMSVCHTVLFLVAFKSIRYQPWYLKSFLWHPRLLLGQIHVHTFIRPPKISSGALKCLLLSCSTKSLLHHLVYLGTKGISPAKNERIALSIISRVSTGSSTMICKPMPLR